MRLNDTTALQRILLTERQRLDLEQILCGGFAPLTGFLSEDDYRSVVESMRLADGTLWPIPVVLDVSDAASYSPGEHVVLCDAYGYPMALFTIESVFRPDKVQEARAVYGTDSPGHPGVQYLLERTGDTYLGGPVELIAYAPVFDFTELRLTPTQMKDEFKKRGWDTVVAFQTRNPIHRAHYEIIRRAIRETGAHALIHPVAGLTKEGDIDYVRRVRGYKHVARMYLGDDALLAILPLAMRMAGPREALWHALIRKNYGATHFIVGRDHAGPGADRSGASLYEPYAAQQLAEQYADEAGISIVAMPEMFFSEKAGRYVPATELQQDDTPLRLSGTAFRAMLERNEEIPEWFSFPEVIEELRATAPTRGGIVLFFTGLPSAGKTTIARILYQKLLEMNVAGVEMLDGDLVRARYPKQIGFDKASRNAHIARLGVAADEIAQRGGIAICAAVAPYREAREANRKRINEHARYIEIFVSTPLSVCELRDTKGLYKKARAGLISQFTGIDDPYEIPERPEITINTAGSSPEECAQRVLDYLLARGVLR